MKLNDILISLPSLTQAELATVRATVDRLATAQEPAIDNTTPLYDVLCKIINVKVPYRDFTRGNAYKAWRKHAPTIIDFIEETWPEAKRSKVIKLALMDMLIEMLRHNLKSRGIPITIGVMSNNLGTVPEVFDQAFPDYRVSGLSHLILDSIKGKTK